MATQNYYVVGGEYADTSFTAPAPGTQLEVRGPFNERDAKVCWRELTGFTVDNAMVRYFLKSEDEISGKNYWVIGGEYADSKFTRMREGAELEVYGPFDKWEAALGFWRGLTSKSVDDALVRYDIRENYQPGDGIPSLRIAADVKAVQPTATKHVSIAAAAEKVFGFLVDGMNWPKWAVRSVKGAVAAKPGLWEVETSRGQAQLSIKGDAASGTLDHAFRDATGASWTVPGRVVAAGGGAVVVMIFTKPTALSDSQFTQAMRQIDDELAALKRVLEGA